MIPQWKYNELTIDFFPRNLRAVWYKMQVMAYYSIPITDSMCELRFCVTGNSNTNSILCSYNTCREHVPGNSNKNVWTTEALSTSCSICHSHGLAKPNTPMWILRVNIKKWQMFRYFAFALCCQIYHKDMTLYVWNIDLCIKTHQEKNKLRWNALTLFHWHW